MTHVSLNHLWKGVLAIKRKRLLLAIATFMLTVVVAVVTVSASFDSETYPSNTTLYAPSYTLYLEYAEGEAGEVFETIQLPTMVGIYFGSTVEMKVELSGGALAYTLTWNANYDLSRVRLCASQTFGYGNVLAYLRGDNASGIPVRLSSAENYYDPDLFDVGEGTINVSNGAIDTVTSVSTSLVRNLGDELRYYAFRQAVANFRSVPYPIDESTSLRIYVPLVQADLVRSAFGTIMLRGYNEGSEVGGEANATGIFDGIISGVTSVFNTPLFGDVGLGDLLYVALAVIIVVVALKFFAGG